MIAEAILAMGGIGAILIYTIFGGSEGVAAAASSASGEAVPLVEQVLGQILLPFTLAVESTFTIVAQLAPLLLAVVPLYLVLNAQNLGKDRRQMVVFSAIFGLALYGIAYFTGVDKLLAQEMKSSFMVGSTLDMAVATLGASAEWVIGVVTGLVLWGAGFALSILGTFLDALVGVGKAAEAGSRGVSRAKKSILGRLGR